MSTIDNASPLDTAKLAEIGRQIGAHRKAGTAIPLALSLSYVDGAVPAAVAALLPRAPMGRDVVFAACEKVFGERPDAKKDAQGNYEWQRAHDANVTRLTRAGLILTADGGIAVPAGRTKNVGARSLGAAGADSGDVTYMGEKFSRVDAAGLVKILGRRWSASLICDALRAHGYSFADPTEKDVEDCEDEAFGDWKRIVDPKPMSVHEKARMAEVARVEAIVDGLVADGDVPADRRDAAIGRRMAAWDAAHPAAPPPPTSAPEGEALAAAPAEGEAAPEAAPEPPAELTTAPEGETKTAEKKRLRALREWRAEHAPAAAD